MKFTMIDFHTHILPNIDDGSKSIEETFNLIKEAEKAGFKKIISTSHYLEKYHEKPGNKGFSPATGSATG